MWFAPGESTRLMTDHGRTLAREPMAHRAAIRQPGDVDPALVDRDRAADLLEQIIEVRDVVHVRLARGATRALQRIATAAVPGADVAQRAAAGAVGNHHRVTACASECDEAIGTVLDTSGTGHAVRALAIAASTMEQHDHGKWRAAVPFRRDIDEERTIEPTRDRARMVAAGVDHRARALVDSRRTTPGDDDQRQHCANPSHVTS